MKFASYTCLFLLCAFALTAADEGRATVSRMEDGSLTMLEHELVPLAEAMPADKYDFAPANGDFKGVRTFAQEMTHIATVMYECSADILGEKNPVEVGEAENGSKSIQGKDAIVKYLKDSFAYAHRAMQSLTEQNFTEMVDSPFGRKMARGTIAEIPVWHSYDHYGQAVEYARMCGVIPPASR